MRFLLIESQKNLFQAIFATDMPAGNLLNYRSVDYELRIPEGNYTYSEFLVRLTEKLNEVVPIKSVGFIDNNLSDPINPICGEIKFIIDDPDNQAYFNRNHASNTLQNYPWTRFFLNAKNIKNLSLARADEVLPRRNDATFLDDTYIDYDYVMLTGVQHYFDDVTLAVDSILYFTITSSK